MNNTMMGRNIKEMRLHRELDLEKFAEKCKVDLSVVEKWENDELVPTCQELFVIAKVLCVNMEYFFEEIGNDEDEFGYLSPCSDEIMFTMGYLSQLPDLDVARRVLIWRLAREYIANYKLKQFDTPKYTVENTTEKQRKKVVYCFENLFDGEYDEILEGYVKGDNELKLLHERLCEEDRGKDEFVLRDRKRETAVWTVYKECVNYLSNALFNEFIDLRYAAVAVEKLNNYLSEHHEGINEIILQLIYDELKISCEKNDEENIRKIYVFLDKYGDALWSQLLETDRIEMSKV